MIEHKELGLKVAEDKTEAFWSGLKDKVTADIESSEHAIEISKHILKLVETKIKPSEKKLPAGVG